MDKQRAVAEKYAKALFDALKTLKARSKAHDELSCFIEAAKSSQTHDFFANPSVAQEDKQRIFAELAEQSGAFGEVKGFVSLLIENDRFDVIEDVRKLYADMLAKEKKIVSGKAEFAKKPTKEQIAELKKALAPRFGNDIDLAVDVNPSLLGGVRVYVGSSMFDFTLDSRLRALKEHCKKAS